MNVWLMKTFLSWGNLFLQGPFFVAIDEEGINVDYGSLSPIKRIELFTQLQQTYAASVQYGLVKRFFDSFYDLMDRGDAVILGVGRRAQFLVAAILRITGSAQFHSAVPPAIRAIAEM